MRILIIKTSSIGDLIHTIPAIVDSKNHLSNLTIDWLVDEQFVEVVKLIKNFSAINLIDQILTIPLRQIKQHPWAIYQNITHLQKFLTKLRQQQYDGVIDPQGLFKSAIMAKLAKTNTIFGANYNSCREPLASCLYNVKINIPKELHAITKIRSLFAQALQYQLPSDINYAWNFAKLKQQPIPWLKNLPPYIILFNSTTWDSKHWPLEYWLSLVKILKSQTCNIIIFSNNQVQAEFALKLRSVNPRVTLLSNLNIFEIAVVIANAMAVIGVDTGFTHLAASLNIPTIGIYGATAASRVGVLNTNGINLQSNYYCSPCFAKRCKEYQQGKLSIPKSCYHEIHPEMVFHELSKLINFSSL